MRIHCPLFQEDSVHDSLAHSVANAVLTDPTDTIAARLYCRVLSQMQLTSSNRVQESTLLSLVVTAFGSHLCIINNSVNHAEVSLIVSLSSCF